MTLVSDLSVNVSASYSTALDLATGSVPLLKSYRTLLASGTAVGQADKVWHDQRTIGASGSEDLDLAGVLTDAFGASLTFVKLKGLIVAAAAGNTNNVVLGGAANAIASFLSPAATGLLTIRPGTVFALLTGSADATGYAVTAGTGDLLHVANSGAGTSVTYDVIVIGTSA
jgi:hypothetical protein